MTCFDHHGRRALAAWLGAALLTLAPACGGGSGRAPGGGDEPFVPPGADDVRLDSDPGLSVFPEIACAGDRVYVTWYDRRAGNTDVYFNRSLDGGTTWLATETRLDTDAPGAAGSNVPKIACDGDSVVVVWSDQRSALSEIRVNRSTDAGTTWLAQDLRVDRDVPADGFSWNPDVCRAGDRVYAVWQDSRNGLSDVYFSRSLDGGLTWSAVDTRLDTDVPGAAMSEYPRIVCANDTLYVAWQDDRDGETDVYFNRSLDGGATWLAADVRLDTDLPGEAASWQPHVACDGARVAVAWSDDRDGERDVRVNASADSGTTFLLDDRRVDTDAPGAGDSLVPQVCVRGAAVYAVWEDFRDGLSDVHFSRSEDGGATWLPQDVRVNTDPPGTASAFLPQIACDAGGLVVVWYDDRKGGFDVLLAASADFGDSWPKRETRMDTDAPGAADSVAPRLCLDGGRARVVFYDQRDGPGDIYFNATSAP